MDVKSIGPIITVPEHGLHKGILERSASPARRGRRQGQEVRCRQGIGRKADGLDQRTRKGRERLVYAAARKVFIAPFLACDLYNLWRRNS